MKKSIFLNIWKSMEWQKDAAKTGMCLPLRPMDQGVIKNWKGYSLPKWPKQIRINAIFMQNHIKLQLNVLRLNAISG